MSGLSLSLSLPGSLRLVEPQRNCCRTSVPLYFPLSPRMCQSGSYMWQEAKNNNRIQRRTWRFFFFTISSQRREPSLTRSLKWPGRNRVQITGNTSSAYHVQHVKLRATRYEGTVEGSFDSMKTLTNVNHVQKASSLLRVIL